MRILVTGSTGFIGAHICRALLAEGHSVRAFHRPTSARLLLGGLAVEHAEGDLTQPATIEEAMQGIEAVFHVAALLGEREKPGRMYAITVEGTRAVLQAARKAGVRRLVYTSSAAALGVPEQAPRPSAQPSFLDERHTWNYRPDYWPYAYAKYLAEMEVQFAVGQGLEAVIVNPTVVMGAGDIYRQTSSLVMQVARRRLPALIEGGLNVVHIADVVAGHLAALEKGRCGERYLLGGENLTLQQLVQKAAAAARVDAPPIVLPAALARALVTPLRLAQPFINAPAAAHLLRLAGRYFYYDTRKALLELGLPQPRPVEDAIGEALAWFRESGTLPGRAPAESSASSEN